MARHAQETASEEAGRAIADSIIDAMESSVLGLANAIRAVREEQARARQEQHTLLQRVDEIERLLRPMRDRLGV